MNGLMYARQFLLGPRVDSRLTEWRHWDLQRGLMLQTHPKLACAQRKSADRTLTLMGFALTPEDPKRGQDEILDYLLDQAGTMEAVLAASDSLSGRWVLIYEDRERSVLFQDATGLRTAVHTLPSCPETWCASQPQLIADQLGLERDAQALAFWETLGTKISRHIRAWPGASTAFSDIRALLPNHFLDLGTREVVRFFPRDPLAPISLAEGTERISQHLRASLQAAHHRYPVYQQITAGLDSRAILAASRGVHENTTYFTSLWTTIDPAISPTHRDVAIPKALLASLGLEHRLYACPDVPLDASFAQAFASCDAPPLDELSPAVRALDELLPDDAMVINGNGGEIGRCRLHQVEHPAAISLSDLSDKHWFSLGQHPFLKPHLAAWQADAAAACERTGYRLLDLFYWEQKMSRRVARGFLHTDMAHETFSPYNSRALLCLYLAVPEEFRRPGGGHALQHAVIKALWPEALDQEINPANLGFRATRMFRRLRRRARGLGLPV